MAHIIDMRTLGQDSYTATYRYDGDQIVCTLVDYQQDLESLVEIGDTVVALTGWPTDGMRPVLGDDGEPTGEWVGCDADGVIRPLTDGLYVVRSEYREAWGSPQPGTSVDMDDIRHLAETWGVTVESLMDQVQPALYYRASDGVESQYYEAACMDDALDIARERWDSAEEGTYEVTVYEYRTADDRYDSMSSSRLARTYETITVVAR